MRFYIYFSFWTTLASFLAQIIIIGVTSQWPRERPPEKLGSAVAIALVYIAFCTWTGILLWL